jgi:hypothetical protein
MNGCDGRTMTGAIIPDLRGWRQVYAAVNEPAGATNPAVGQSLNLA